MSKIYVGNLPFQTTPESLTELFQQFGAIKEIAFIKDRYTDEFRGFVFITFESQQSAQEALSMDDKDFMGRKMKVNMAREPEKRTGGGSHSGGGRSSSGGRSSGGFGGGHGGGNRDRGGNGGGNGGGRGGRSW